MANYSADDLRPGAANAVRVCLNIQPSERVTIISDHACRDISAALVHEIEAVGAAYASFVLEDEAPRPLAALPPRIAADMEQSDVSIFAAQVQANELRSRMDITDIVNRRRMRHAHMVNITPRIMTEGMRADYRKVDAISQRVIDVVRESRRIRATTPAGTDITAELNPGYRWVKTSGLITPEKWGNLPGGEVFTTPGSVNGTFVIDGVVGDWLCDRYGLLTAAPLTVTIRDSRLTGAHSTNQALRDDFWAYTHTDA
jgi:aminopeptidase